MLEKIDNLKLELIKGEIISSEIFKNYALINDFEALEEALPPIGILEECERKTLTEEETTILFSWDEPTNTSLIEELNILKEINRIGNELKTEDSNFTNFKPSNSAMQFKYPDYISLNDAMEEISTQIEETIERKICEGIALLKEQCQLDKKINLIFWEKVSAALDKLAEENQENDLTGLSPDLSNFQISPTEFELNSNLISLYKLSIDDVERLNKYFKELNTRIHSQLKTMV